MTIDARKLLFSLSSFLAAAITLAIVFSASLPRPWWALLTVYVTAQPMAGAFRPKMLYRLAGIATGAIVTIAVVPNLQNAPELLVLCMAAWTGFCIYLAVLDRTPRAFLFQMAAFSSAVISFPYIENPADIFDTTAGRVAEMTVAILSVSMVHAVLQPWSATPVIRDRAKSFLRHARRWSVEVLSGDNGEQENAYRRALASDVTELGMIAIHLPFDQRAAPITQRRVFALQQQLANTIPLASAAANRLDVIERKHGILPELNGLLVRTMDWLGSAESRTAQVGALIDECERLARQAEDRGDWPSLLAASASIRLAQFLNAFATAQRLANRIGLPGRLKIRDGHEQSFRLARDHGVAVLAGAATAAAIILYCAVWILLAWPSGSATAAFAALITCSFAAHDDPSPMIGRYLKATLKTFPLAAFYLFVVLPRVDGYEMLMITLAPALLWMGYIQADPRRSPEALPMFSCFIVAMGFLARFQADFSAFVNTGIAQLGGIVTTLAVTRLFRTASARWTLRRVMRANWTELALLADIRRPFRPGDWTARSVDRLGQIAQRIVAAPPGDDLHAADSLADLRIGRNVIPVRKALSHVPHDLRHDLGLVLAGVADHYRDRTLLSKIVPADAALLVPIDRSIDGLHTRLLDEYCRQALRALVAMRCNLFPEAAAPVLTTGKTTLRVVQGGRA
ncbi:putative membrane protein YccC [Sphingobium vermicomposti]|uniref:Putative membrane protein YccC n=1 Tax=Sphingobium vermicomposti TaxID=529005 RepID=A0A846MER0_9SPHN|nr:putative membrane protein YccC [Sphingobium vermicomposti]